jgi:hypothetical protein
MKKQFVFIHMSHLEDDVRIISVSSSLINATRRAEKFMKRHEYDGDYRFHAIEKWKINSESEAPDEVWEYEITRVDKPERWVKLEEIKGKFWRAPPPVCMPYPFSKLASAKKG